MFFLGISAYYHDSSVALIDSAGKLIDFKKEEWLSRVKGDKSFPRLALQEMIKNFNLSENNIEKVCFYEKPLKAWLTILKYSVKNNSLSNELTRNYFKNIWKSSIIFSYDLSKHLKISNDKSDEIITSKEEKNVKEKENTKEDKKENKMRIIDKLKEKVINTISKKHNIEKK